MCLRYFILMISLIIPSLSYAQIAKNINIKNLSMTSGIYIPVSSTTFTVDSNFFYDNGYNVLQSGYIQTSTQARATFSTTASSIVINMYNNGMYANYSGNGYCSIGVLVNDVSIGQVNCTKAGAESQVFSLGSPGSKTVELRNGFIEDRSESGNIYGTFLTSVTFIADALATKTVPSPTKRIVIYGDSISCGAADFTPNQTGWPMRLRDYYGPTGSVMSEGISSNALHYDVSTNGTPTSMGNRLAGYFTGYSTKILWIAHGHNDKGRWTSAQFGVSYGQLLDAIHSADSGILIYAQTPILSTVDTGYPAYRTEIINACTARPSYCTNVDGTAILNGTTDLEDGTHPTAAAQVLYYNAVKTALGI